MTFDQFLEKVASEPNRRTERDVRVATDELTADVHRRGGMRLTDFVAEPRKTVARRVLRTGHLLGPGVSPVALAEWKARWPRHPLPDDLGTLLGRVNGIHLWANLDTGRSYDGLAPLEEWNLARVKMWGADADEGLLADRYLALSYNSDSAAFIVLNVETGQYFLMDSAGADESSPIGGNVGTLLDWLWEHRIP